MALFLDANVYLSFYHFSKDDIVIMEKVARLVEESAIKLLVNRQLCDEIERNRHSKLREGLGELRKTRYGQAMPSYCKDFAEFDELSAALKTANEAHKALVNKAEDAISERGLRADKLIDRLLSAGSDTIISEELLAKARLRVDLGNPPGKNRSLGDAIHWECLLSSGQYDLHLVSQDGDFASALYPNTLHSFLQNEWSAKSKWHSASFYSTLGAYLSSQHPGYELHIEKEKDEAIKLLESSKSFSETHMHVGTLLRLGDFTPLQSKALCEALTANNQIGMIATDIDIQALYHRLTDNAFLLTSEETMSACDQHLGWKTGTMSIPF